MSSLTALTGESGQFVVDGNTVARTTEWDVSPTLAHKSEWGDSDSGGFTNRIDGRRDCKFSANGKFDTETDYIQYNIFFPGDILTAVLWMNTSLYWYFPRALNEDFKLSVNIDSEEVIGWTSSWGADGRYYKPGHVSAPAATYPTDIGDGL